MIIPVAGFSTTLTKKIASTDTTIYIDSITDDDGNTLAAQAYGFIIDEGTADEEFVIGTVDTVNGDRLNTCNRGISVSDGSTEVADRKNPHRKKSTIKITNHPYLLLAIRIINGDDAFTDITQTLGDGSKMATDAAPAANEEIANKKYVDDVGSSGAADATTTVKGIVEIATTAETKAGTDTGGTGAKLSALPSDAAANIQSGTFISAVDSAGSDTYAITLVPAISAYTTGQMFVFQAGTANTGAATLNVNAKGAKPILKNNDQVLEDGDIEANMYVIVIYDGTSMQLQSQQATMPTTALLTEMAVFFGSTDISGAEAETLTDGSNADLLHIHGVLSQEQLSSSGGGGSDSWVLPPLDIRGDVAATSYFNISNVTETNPIENISGNGATTDYINLTDEPLDSSKDFTFNCVLKMTVQNNSSCVWGVGEEAVLDGIAVAGTTTDHHAAFIATSTGTKLYASVADGSTQNTEEITGITLTDYHNWKVVKSGSNVLFYIDGVLKKTLTTNLPTDTTVTLGVARAGGAGSTGCQFTLKGAFGYSESF